MLHMYTETYEDKGHSTVRSEASKQNRQNSRKHIKLNNFYEFDPNEESIR